MNAKELARFHALTAALVEAKAEGDWDRADRIQMYLDEIVL